MHNGSVDYLSRAGGGAQNGAPFLCYNTYNNTISQSAPWDQLVTYPDLKGRLLRRSFSFYAIINGQLEWLA